MSQANAQDMAQGWQLLSSAQRAAVKSDYASAGIKLIITGSYFSTYTESHS